MTTELYTYIDAAGLRACVEHLARRIEEESCGQDDDLSIEAMAVIGMLDGGVVTLTVMSPARAKSRIADFQIPSRWLCLDFGSRSRMQLGADTHLSEPTTNTGA